MLRHLTAADFRWESWNKRDSVGERGVTLGTEVVTILLRVLRRRAPRESAPKRVVARPALSILTLRRFHVFARRQRLGGI
jgi:hypothetical protein